MSERASVRSLIGFIALVIAGLAIVLLSGGPMHVLEQVAAKGESLRAFASHWRLGSALLFMAAYAGLMTTLLVPAWPCTIIGAFIFGFWLGALYALIGASLGATGAFLLARSGLPRFTRGSASVAGRLEAGLRRDAFSYLLALRIFPLVPFALINLGSAVVGVPLRTFVSATAIGILPSTLIYASLGYNLELLLREQASPSIWSHPTLALSLVALAVLVLAPVVYRRIRP